MTPKSNWFPHAASRWLPYHGFHTGYKKMHLAPDELLRAIRLPRRAQDWRQYYRKVGTRKAQAISKVCFAGAALMENGAIRDIRIALGSVAPIVMRAVKTEEALRGYAVNHSAGAWRGKRWRAKLRRSTTFARPRATACASRKTCSKNFSRSSQK